MNEDTTDRVGRYKKSMLLIIALILPLLWGGGFAFHIAGGLVHLLLVVALIVFILHFVGGRRGV